MPGDGEKEHELSAMREEFCGGSDGVECDCHEARADTTEVEQERVM